MVGKSWGWQSTESVLESQRVLKERKEKRRQRSFVAINAKKA
jgi:hypothetical protein